MTSPAGRSASAPEEEPDEPLFRFPRPEPRVAVAGLGLLRRRRWAGVLLAVVALSAVFVGLGRWQYHRHEGKVERRDLVRANYDASPAPVGTVLDDGALPPARQWRPVTAEGRFEPTGRLMVRNRPLAGQAGFHELVPLRLDDGRLLVVDRGWLPVADSGAGAPAFAPTVPTGRVQVVARVRPFERPTDRSAPPGQVSRIDRDQVTRAMAGAGVEGRVLGGYAVLSAQTPATTPSATLLPRPDVDLGVHQAYAYQWWIFAGLLYVVLGVALYREAQAGRGVGSVTGATGTDRADRSERKAQDGPPDADDTPEGVTVRITGPPLE